MGHIGQWWRNLGAASGRGGRASRTPRAFQPGGAETSLEGRQLLSLQVATFEAPPVAQRAQDITTGPDGNLWFPEPAVGKIGRMTPTGAVTEFPLPPGHDATNAITAGPDGNLWFTEAHSIGRITTTGVVTEFAAPPGANLTGITAGADGNLWFMDTGNQKVGRITPKGAITEITIPPSTSQKTYDPVTLFHDITAGPDGNVWYTAQVYNHATKNEFGEIGRVTPGGTVTVYLLSPTAPGGKSRGLGKTKPTGGMLADAITAGPDGNVWFTEHQANGVAAVGRITPDGHITQFLLPTIPSGAKIPDISTDITPGPDGNLWFNLVNDDFLNGPNPSPYVGRITPSGRINVYAIPTAKDAQAALLADGAESMTAGPDGKVWFTGVSRRFVSQTGRVVGELTPP